MWHNLPAQHFSILFFVCACHKAIGAYPNKPSSLYCYLTSCLPLTFTVTTLYTGYHTHVNLLVVSLADLFLAANSLLRPAFPFLCRATSAYVTGFWKINHFVTFVKGFLVIQGTGWCSTHCKVDWCCKLHYFNFKYLRCNICILTYVLLWQHSKGWENRNLIA